MIRINNSLLIILIIIFLCAENFSQENIQIGKSRVNIRDNNSALYDYSDPDGINMKIMVWGNVKYPGQYIVSSNNNINELISLAGGPNTDTDLDELKLFRINPDSSQTIIQFNYSDLMDNKGYLNNHITIPKLQPGDVLLVPGSPKWYLKDYLGLMLSVLSTIASISTILVYLYSK